MYLASLTVNGVLYEEFHQRPFKRPFQGECIVEFKQTDNPHIYDIEDRLKKQTPEEEMNPQPRPPLPDLNALPPPFVFWDLNADALLPPPVSWPAYE